MIDRSLLRAALLDALQAEFDLQVRAAQLARDEATNEESRAEGKYDTRAQEAAYLAEGQARVASDLQLSLSLYRDLTFPAPADPIAVGHLVQLGDDEAHIYLLGPKSGGLEITVDGHQILVVTPASPLGRQLLGARLGATVTLPGRPARSLPIRRLW